MGDQTKNASNSDDIAELVSKHVNNLDDKGKLQLPEDMPDWQKHVIRSEKRQRDAQSALGVAEHKLAEADAVNGVLTKQITSKVTLTEEEATALNDLKFKDPEKYRQTLNRLESEADEKQTETLKELTDKARTDAGTSFTATTRTEVLANFRTANPELSLTDDVLVNDVPPRFMNDLNAGKDTYEEYLVKVAEYLSTGKKVVTPGNTEEHNLSHQPGSQTPGKGAAERAGKTDYSKVTL